MKKDYQKPTMRVIEFQQKTHILTGSDPQPNGYDDDFGYVPSIGKDMNKLA